jgi:choline monooxygenase
VSRTLRQILEAFDPTLPLERARTIPSAWYLDSEVAALERSSVFGDTWQLAARTDQLAAPGSFVTASIAGEPILLVRDEAGTLRAFFNVCRHRAACVVTEPQGATTRLRCRYHGWTYDLAGRLRGTPEFDGVDDFSKEDHGLVPVAVDTWGPLVFVSLARQPLPLGQTLAPLPDKVGSLDALRFFERREYQLACNWKIFVDNYLDGGYHVNTVHPALGSVLQYSQYRTECFGLSGLQSSPIRASGATSGEASAFRQGSTAWYGWVFPNFMINVYAGVMDTNLVFPMGMDRCRVLIDFYFAETEGDDARHFAEQSVALGHRIQLEDIGICEDVQRGLASRSYDTGRFSVRREAGGYHFHRLLAERLRAAASERQAAG